MKKLLIFIILYGQFALAAVPISNKNRIQELKNRSAGLISEAANRRLTRAQELAAQEQYKDAIHLLSEYISKPNIRKNEKAQFLQNLGFILAQKGDYKVAIVNLKKAIDTKQLPYGPNLSTQFALGQLYIAKENYSKAILTLEDWFRVAEKPNPQAYIALATAYSQLGKKAKSLELVEIAISKSNNPPENWLLFSLGLNYELKKWSKCSDLLKHLTGQFPQKSQYWKQLAGVYLNMGHSSKALTILELAHKQGHLEREGEFINLAALYLDQGIPLKAANMLKKKMEAGKLKSNLKNLELVADSLINARNTQDALIVISKATKHAIDGNIFVKQGHIYLEQEKWNKAISSFRNAIKKGDLKSPEQVHLKIGIAFFNLQDYSGALSEFKLAQKIKQDYQAAQRWIDYSQNALVATTSGL